MVPYTDSVEHLRDEISRLDLMLKRAVIIARDASSGTGADEFRGLVVTENEVDDLLRATDLLGEPWQRVAGKQTQLAPLDKELEKRRKQIDGRVKASRGKKVQLALLNLAAQFDLSQAEVDVLIIALSPELEPRYETLYSYLQNDVTRKHASVNLALNLICRSEAEKLNARGIFSREAPLFYHCLSIFSTKARIANLPCYGSFSRSTKQSFASCWTSLRKQLVLVHFSRRRARSAALKLIIRPITS